MTGVPIPDRVAGWGDRTAIVDPSGTWTYRELDDLARRDATELLDGRDDLDGARVAVLAEPGHEFVRAALGVWHAGGIVVPLLPGHPPAELSYLLDDAGAEIILAGPAHRDVAEQLVAPARVAVLSPAPAPGNSGQEPTPGVGICPELRRSVVGVERAALMIHTSGTTGRPKGAVHTHAGLAAQVDGMLEAWAWSPDDRVVLVLPLNHMHGLVNVALTALAAGACCEAPGRFDAVHVWERFASGDVTVFMAVPTVYARLVAAWEAADEPTRQRWSDGARRLRLMVSGSAALPVSTLERWRELTGHVLLERYGMTELGMVLSNTLEHRVPGHVGWPMPGVEVRLVDDDGRDVPAGASGELLVRGGNVFQGYWGRPDATAEAFREGWFRTGDVGVLDPDGYRLLGRSSVDIIKSGGEKISALEIEEIYRAHPDVADVAVVGLEDPEWGQRVGAAVVARRPGRDDAAALRAWGKERLAAPKVPTRWRFVDELPRNTLGKVVKPRVVELFADGRVRDP